MTAKKTTEPNLESALTELEKLVEQMENNKLPLEESLKLFERGVQLTKICQQKLSQAEQKVQKLSDNKEKLVNFDTE